MEPGKFNKKFNYFNYFVKSAKTAQKREDSVFYAYVGRRRSGKSVNALATCSAIDPDFSEENIVFTLNELKMSLKEKKETAVMWDEASVTAYSRDFMQEANKVLNKVIQVYGYKKIALCCTFQHLNFLDSHTRLQIDTIFRCFAKSKDVGDKCIVHTYMEPFIIATDWIRDPLLAPYKIAIDGVYQDMGSIPLPQVEDLYNYTGVSKKLQKAYMKKKNEFFETVGEEENKPKLDKRTLNKLSKIQDGYFNLIDHFQGEGITLTKMAEISGIPQPTISRWKTDRIKEKTDIKS